MPANLISVPSLRSELLQSTVLTPTYHKSKGLSIVIGVVAGIATGGLGTALSNAVTFLSPAVATAMVGAGVGAAMAKVAGGDPLYGALAGGASGFVRGGGLDTLFGPATAGADAPFPNSEFEPLVETNAQVPYTFPDPAVQLPAPTGALSFGLDSTPALDIDNLMGDYSNSFISKGGDTFVDPAGVTYNPNVQASSMGTDLNAGDPSINVVSARSLWPGPGTPAAAEKSWYSDFIPTKKDIVGGALDFAVSGLTRLGQEAPPLTPEEEELLRRQNAALDTQERLQGRKEDIANQQFAQARAISPLQQGQQQFALAQDRFGRLAREQERRFSSRDTGALAGLRRRNILDKSRLGDFRSGFESAQREQNRLTTAAAGTLPTGSGLTASTASALAAADKRFLRQDQENQNRARILSTILGNPGVLTEDERKKRADELRAGTLS